MEFIIDGINTNREYTRPESDELNYIIDDLAGPVAFVQLIFKEY